MRFLLTIFGWSAVIASTAMILIPYLLRKRDLINFWTLFQLGCANFMGITAIQSGSSLMHQYSTPQDPDYVKYAVGGTVFYVVISLTYFLFSWPEKRAMKTFNKWGPRRPGVMIALVPICWALAMGYVFVPQVQFVGQWLSYFGRPAGVFAMIFCFVAWAQRPLGFWWPVMAAVCALFAAVEANVEFGRRDLLGLIVAIPLAWYWLRGRYLNPARAFTYLSIAAFCGSVALMGVSAVRSARKTPGTSVINAAWDKVKAIPAAFNSSTDASAVLGGDACDTALAAIRLYDTTQPTEPFHSLFYVLSHPVPRAWWPEKPEPLGDTLMKDNGYVHTHGYLNVGPNIIGHGYHEGGAWIIAIYAFLWGSALRFLDTLMMKDPSNPYLLGFLGSMSGQIIAFARGDIGLFTVLIIGGGIAALLVSRIARSIFGTEHWQPALPLEQQSHAFDEEIHAHAGFDPALSGEGGDVPRLRGFAHETI